MATAPVPVDDAVEQYLAAVSVGDRAAAAEVVGRLQRAGVAVLDIMTAVIAPAQTRVGELWATDAWSVAQEHAATAVSEAVLGQLAALIPPPSDTAAPVLVSCVEQEWHALPALLVAEHLRAAGLPVSYLGANASAEHLVRHIDEVRPRAVALSCSLSSSLPRVRRQLEAVRATGTPVLVGGAAFDPAGRRAATLGADAYASNGALAVQALRELPSTTTPLPPLSHAGAEEGFAIYGEREALTAELRAKVAAARPATGLRDVLSGWQHALFDHLPHLVSSVAAALVTNDPDLLDDSIAWLAGVMSHRDAPDDIVEVVNRQLRVVLRGHPAAVDLIELERA